MPDLSARIMRSALVSEFKLDWSDFCRSSSVRPMQLDDCAGELLVQEEIMLQQAFADCTAGAATIWFDIGLRYRSIKYGPLGLAMMTAATLGEALAVACRYQSLTYSLITYEYAANADGSCALNGNWSDHFPHLHDFTEHRDLGAIRTLVADLMGGALPLERVRVKAPPPANWAQLQHLFPCPVEFNAERTCWMFLPGAAHMALPLADNELQSLYTSRCDWAIGQARTTGSIRDRLMDRLIRRDGSALSAGEAAQLFALSERTLHRRLAEEGTRFSDIVDDARYARARQMLADRRNSVEMVAFALGYAEPSSFSRAFKRWSGIGALEFRRRELGVPPAR
ncbi:AraC family transcriptional regulator [Sandarakinorhabdus rubra]|uniref:AraC family transcriptional regulator n=1 Tax=Sandarakinorhabdus rubra TaxID=2672568 RepID=UPI0013DB57A3|nr:AraC family transcriptional regulator [Sandarakinorhabdus rubra]